MKKAASKQGLDYFADSNNWHAWNILPERPRHGQETTFLWKGSMPASRVRLIPVESSITAHISSERLAQSAAKWQAEYDRRPADAKPFDAGKWRTESVHYDPARDELLVCISPMNYSLHAGLRSDRQSDGTPYPLQAYPNPITLNTVQVTLDDHVVIAARGKGSDQQGLCLLGSGFIERRSGTSDGASRLPKRLVESVQEECLTEALYNGKKGFPIEDLDVLGIVFGSNHDSTFATRVLVPYRSDQVQKNPSSDEHNCLIFLPNDKNVLVPLLERGYHDFEFDGRPIRGTAADHMLGCLELHLEHPLNVPDDMAASYKPIAAQA